MAEAKRRRAQPKYQEPIVYSVGTDITQEQYEQLIVTIADYFRETRDTKEPAALARSMIKCCLEGRTTKGQKWFTAATATFASRVRQLCRFDVDTMQPLGAASPETKQKKDKVKRKKLEEQLRRQELVPDETRKLLRNGIKYGDQAAVFLTEKEHELHQSLMAEYVGQFPELATVNGRAELAMLCDLHVVHERNRMRLLMGDKVDSAVLTDYTKQMAIIKSALGIHPDQLQKRVQKQQGGTVGEAAAALDAMDPDLRQRFWLEELIIKFQKYITPSPRPDMGGFQLDDVGLLGETGCRACVCSNCGQRNYVGLEFGEIVAYLEKHGRLIRRPEMDRNKRELPVMPTAEVLQAAAEIEEPLNQLLKLGEETGYGVYESPEPAQEPEA